MTTIFQTKKRAGDAAGSKAGLEKLRKRTKQHEKQAAKHAKRHGRKHKKKHKHRKPAPRPTLHGSAGVALPLAPAAPLAPSPTPPPSIGSPPITLAQAHRLLWRAGFGPTPGQAEALVGRPLQDVVHGLTRPPVRRRSAGRRRSTTKAIRSIRTMRGATTTVGGWTAWCAQTSNSSSE